MYLLTEDESELIMLPNKNEVSGSGFHEVDPDTYGRLIKTVLIKNNLITGIKDHFYPVFENDVASFCHSGELIYGIFEWDSNDQEWTISYQDQNIKRSMSFCAFNDECDIEAYYGYHGGKIDFEAIDKLRKMKHIVK